MHTMKTKKKFATVRQLESLKNECSSKYSEVPSLLEKLYIVLNKIESTLPTEVLSDTKYSDPSCSSISISSAPIQDKILPILPASEWGKLYPDYFSAKCCLPFQTDTNTASDKQNDTQHISTFPSNPELNVWQTPKKKCIQRSKSDNQIFNPTDINYFNHFTILTPKAKIISTPEDSEEICNDDVSNPPGPSFPQTKQKNTRRPPVVVSLFPEKNQNIASKKSRQQVPVSPPSRVRQVPGRSLYSQVLVDTTVLISDSLAGGINRRGTMEDLNEKEENIIVKKFPGATSTEIYGYSKTIFEEQQFYRAILMDGINDLIRNPDNIFIENTIVQNLILTGKLAKDNGVKEVCILALPQISNKRHWKKIQRVNTLLQAECLNESFIFIHLDDILPSFHFGQDGLHFNNYGTVILRMQILLCFYSFNPYISSFLTFYEKAISFNRPNKCTNCNCNDFNTRYAA